MRVFTKEDVFQTDEDQISVTKRITLRKEKEELHSHEFIEMTYYLDGGAVHTINGQSFEVKKGDLLVLNANQAHSHSTIDFVSYIHIFVKSDYMRSLLNTDNTLELFFLSSLFDEFDDTETFSPVINFRGKEMIEMESMCEMMYSEYENRAMAYDMVLESYVKILLAKILRNIHFSNDKKWIREMRRVTPDIIDFLNKNYSDTLTVQDFAKHSFYSPTYFNRLFKSCYGKSIKEYIAEKRIQDAVELLCKTDLSVDKIASEVGYTNRNQFYKIFKSYTGETPAQFRKSQK